MRNDVKLLSLAGSIVASAVIVVALQQPASQCHWQSQMDMQSASTVSITTYPSPTCDGDVTEVSWFSWLAGKSASYQFHFLDLLELLYKHDTRQSKLATPAG